MLMIVLLQLMVMVVTDGDGGGVYGNADDSGDDGHDTIMMTITF